MPVSVNEQPSFQAFLGAVKKRPGIRLVKLDSYGFVAPAAAGSGGRAWVMMPQVRIVATAYDSAAGEILRWQDTAHASQTVTIHVNTARGGHGESRVLARTEEIKQRFELDGFNVSTGEWTEAEVNRLLQLAGPDARAGSEIVDQGSRRG